MTSPSSRRASRRSREPKTLSSLVGTRQESGHFFVVTGLLATMGAVCSPHILGNGTDPRQSFCQAAVLAAIGILALAVAFPQGTRGARILVALLVVVDLAVIVQFAGALRWLIEW